MDPIPFRQRRSAARQKGRTAAPVGAPPPPVNIEALVNTYAPIGRRRRASARRRRIALVILAPVLAVLAAGTIELARRSLAGSSERDGALERELSALAALRGQMDAERREWERERAAFRQQSTELLAQVAGVEAERRLLEEQRAAVEQRQAELEAALARLEAQASALAAERETSREAAAEFDRRRAELERQREQFRAQSGDVARELREIDAQRLELESQQRALETQRQELQRLMKRFEEAAAAPPAEPAAALTPQPEETMPELIVPQPEEAELIASLPVGDEQLNEMRGGLRLDDLQIAIGLTRTGAINGVEQFSSSVYVDNLAQLGTAAGLAPEQIVVLQSGLGNAIDTGVMDALSGNLGTVIQNTLDNQSITTMTVIDVSLQNVSSIVTGIAASDAIGQSIGLQQ